MSFYQECYDYNEETRELCFKESIVKIGWRPHYYYYEIEIPSKETVNISFSKMNPKNIKFPKSLKCIGKTTFANWYISKIDFSKTINELIIEENAFLRCTFLNNINFDEAKIICIEDSAFEDCETLKQIKLPKYLKCIGRGVFRGCKNLKVICIQEVVKQRIPDIEEIVKLGNSAEVVFVNEVDTETTKKIQNNRNSNNNLKNSYCGVMKKNLLVKRRI